MTACLFFFNDTATTEIYTLSLHDALPISAQRQRARIAHEDHGGRRVEPQEAEAGSHDGAAHDGEFPGAADKMRSEEHTSELQSRLHLVCRLLLEKKNKKQTTQPARPT